MTDTFTSLGVDQRIIAGLNSQGITQPLPIQAATLRDAFAGRDICGKADTGSGKTLAFGIALLQQGEQGQPKNPRSLVIVPTRELAVQVKDVLASVAGPRQVRVAVAYGGVSIEAQIRALRQGVDILVATPGRLIDLVNRRAVHLARVTSVVLDEADRMADMGFMPQVEEILGKTFPDRQTMLFSATLDGDVDRLIKRHMNNPVRHEVASDIDKDSKLTQYFLAVDERSKIEALASILSGTERALVFTKTKRGADDLTAYLMDYGIRSSALHGDLHQAARNRVFERFLKGSVHVVVATDVAARGLDVGGLELVVHFDLPDDHKSYIHRSGRTARGGAVGVVVTLLSPRQGREVRSLQRNLGSELPIYLVDPNDSRLGLLVKSNQVSETVEFEEVLEILPKNASGKAAGGYSRGTRGFGRSNSGRSYSSSGASSRKGRNAALPERASSEGRKGLELLARVGDSGSEQRSRVSHTKPRRRSYAR